ncbi:NUDIX domain-containing protein [Halalkalirubrum salinum]|uniref:NUDIX domain-containing protein n=1 Tax=Halalkalirubrum salinum TaxID=2563889 RepID=UPI0010FB0450|nr:NUDIX domain-containing protein [Halalkalirubrum salinum]
MTTVNDLWFLADRASQRAEQRYHRVSREYGEYHTFERLDTVRRRRFRTLATRIVDSGAPYGAHTIVTPNDGQSVLLVRHDGVDKWVLPGGGVHRDETYERAAVRELHEEAGIDAQYEGLASLTRVQIRSGNYNTWGVLPVFEAQTNVTALTVNDPDGEISDAQWFHPDSLPEDTRDRAQLRELLEQT